MNLEPVDLGAEAAAIATDLRDQDPARSVRFTIQAQAWALADRALIREALHSLLQPRLGRRLHRRRRHLLLHSPGRETGGSSGR
jgi:hypothetical protein